MDAGTFLTLGRQRGELKTLWTMGEPERHCPLGLADDLVPILHNRTTLVPNALKLLLGPTFLVILLSYSLNFITRSRSGSRLFQHGLYTHPRRKNMQVLRFERHAKSFLFISACLPLRHSIQHLTINMGVPELKSSKMQVMTRIKSGIELFFNSIPDFKKF